MSPDGNTLTFRSRVDWWLAVVVFGALGSATWAVAVEVWKQPTASNWIAAAVSGLVLALSVWLFTGPRATERAVFGRESASAYLARSPYLV